VTLAYEIAWSEDKCLMNQFDYLKVIRDQVIFVASFFSIFGLIMTGRRLGLQRRRVMTIRSHREALTPLKLRAFVAQLPRVTCSHDIELGHVPAGFRRCNNFLFTMLRNNSRAAAHNGKVVLGSVPALAHSRTWPDGPLGRATNGSGSTPLHRQRGESLVARVSTRQKLEALQYIRHPALILLGYFSLAVCTHIPTHRDRKSRKPFWIFFFIFNELGPVDTPNPPADRGRWRRSLIKVLYCFHQNNDGSKCEVAHTSPPESPIRFRYSKISICTGRRLQCDAQSYALPRGSPRWR
jgi:hypothetical protein